ncbi:MAG: hypothetical protein ACYTFT_01890 [Planctomycetota bacterium]
MKHDSPLLRPFVALRRNKEHEDIFDVSFHDLGRLRGSQELECHLVLYPFDREVSSDEVSVHPFEEYVADLATHRRSEYSERKTGVDHAFGLFLGFAIALIFFWLKPGELFAIDAVVSILGAYFIGKDLWSDIERLLVGLTDAWPLRYRERTYFYQLQASSTLTLYEAYAREQRYGVRTVRPECFDFVKQSTSQTVRMRFAASDLVAHGGKAAHVLSFHIDPDALDAFRGGFLLGIKLSFNRGGFGIVNSTELFQSVRVVEGAQELGALDAQTRAWQPGAVFWRRTRSLGRIKAFLRSGAVPGALATVDLGGQEEPA